MKKKLVFFDGDGTLWYPKSTKRTRKPHWIYHDAATRDNYLQHIELTPKTKETLWTLYKKGIKLIVISANPHAKETAIREIKERLEYFSVSDLFYAYRASEGDDSHGKVAVMLEIIDMLGMTKEDALMVGDSYFYDYLAPREAGIDALFIENKVSKMSDPIPEDLQSIKEVNDLLNILE